MAMLAFEVPLFGVLLLWLLAVLPAALVALAKGRYLMFACGWLTLGLVWIVAAVALAEPDSAWARRFYGPRRLAMATDPLRHSRPRRAVLAWAGGTVAAILVLGLFAARPAPLVGINGEALGHSVGESSILSPCRRAGDSSWICQRNAAGDFDSGGVPHRVFVDALGCWRATRIGRAGGAESRPATGCVRLSDFLAAS